MGGFLRGKLTFCQVKQTTEENKSAVYNGFYDRHLESLKQYQLVSLEQTSQR